MGINNQYKLFWGDIHIHSGLSKCFRHSDFRRRFSFKGNDYELKIATIDECYRYAREESRFDFAALTDHDFNLTDSDWKLTREKAAEFYEPGRFVTFSAYEWTSYAYGHYNIYYLSDDQPIFRCLPVKSNPSQERGMNPFQLRDHLIKNGVPVMIIPHHVAVTHFPIEWDFYNPDIEPLVEITSLWGNFEYYGNPGQSKLSDTLPGYFVQDALARGYKLGFTGGSDDHFGTPGKLNVSFGRRKEALRALFPKKNPLGIGAEEVELNSEGYTAVYAKELTREAIFEALKNRRCYATTGARILLEFQIDGHMMGEEYAILELGAYPEILVKVEGTQKVDRIYLIKNGRTLYTHKGEGMIESFRYVDEKITSMENYYYVRVIQVDGKIAWSSPIWVTWKCLPDLKVSPSDIHIGKNCIKAKIHNLGNCAAENIIVRFYKGLPFVKILDAKLLSLKNASGSRTSPPFKGTLLWREHVNAKTVKLAIRWRGGTEKHNFSGELRIINFKKYFVHPYCFALNKFGGDLFIDDGNGQIKWNVNTYSTFKGLDIIIKPDLYKNSYILVKSLMDGKPRPEYTWVGMNNVKHIPFKLELVKYRDDMQLGRDHKILRLAEGENVTIHIKIAQIPNKIFVIVDPLNTITELNEENNEACLTITSAMA